MSRLFRPPTSVIQRKLLTTQLLVVVIGLVIIISSLSVIARISYQAEYKHNRTQLQEPLRSVQQRWRAWKILNMDSSLEKEMSDFKEKHHLEEVKIVSPSEAEELGADWLLQPSSLEDETLISVPLIVAAKVKVATWKASKDILLWLGVIALLFVTLVTYSSFFIGRVITRPIEQLNRELRRAGNGEDLDLSHIRAIGEIEVFVNEIGKLYRTVKENEQEKALLQVARQVSHDIRSPLSALNIFASSLHEIPEHKKQLVNRIIERISGIANDLLRRSRISPEKTDTLDINTECLVEQEILSIVSEKRLEFENRRHLQISVEISEIEGQLAKINALVFKRILSNLINNSVEAFGDQKGRIDIAANLTENHLRVTVKDNGPGISESILSKLGVEEVSRKTGQGRGYGLGLYHATKAVQNVGGNLRVESFLGQGTEVILEFQRLPSEGETAESRRAEQA